jgi:hypothetical protein
MSLCSAVRKGHGNAICGRTVLSIEKQPFKASELEVVNIDTLMKSRMKFRRMTGRLEETTGPLGY